MLYLIYQTLNWKENDSRLLSYRFAFNHSSDPSELEKLFPKSWRFQPRNDDNGRGWDLVVSLHFEGDEEPSKLLLHLPSPNQLAIGRLTYPYELSGLLELKERVIQLLAVCQLTSSKLDEKLQKILVERVITQSS